MSTRNSDKLKDVDVILLCGGMGTRLRSAVSDRPKPMAAVGKRPFLDGLIEQFKSFGARRFILCTGYMSEFIEDYYSRGGFEVEVLISKEHEPLGTGGAVKNAGSLITSRNFIVANGDSFCDVDLEGLYGEHLRNRAAATITLTRPDGRVDVGTVSIDGSGRILNFAEKEATGGELFVNAGVYVFNEDVLSLIPPEKKVSLENDVFPSLDKNIFHGYVSQASLLDIGTPERLKKARSLMRTK